MKCGTCRSRWGSRSTASPWSGAFRWVSATATSASDNACSCCVWRRFPVRQTRSTCVLCSKWAEQPASERLQDATGRLGLDPSCGQQDQIELSTHGLALFGVLLRQGLVHLAVERVSRVKHQYEQPVPVDEGEEEGILHVLLNNPVGQA